MVKKRYDNAILELPFEKKVESIMLYSSFPFGQVNVDIPEFDKFDNSLFSKTSSGMVTTNVSALNAFSEV